MRIGLIVNPLAGMGGPLALKGSDAGLAARALAAGAVPLAGDRAAAALGAAGCQMIELFTSGGAMGEVSARAAGFNPIVVHAPDCPSGAEDTVRAAHAIVAQGVDLIVFAGGDGTARDLLRADLGELAVLGVPAGVKMHSAVFATSPAAVGSAIAALSAHRHFPIRPAEVVDRDPVTGGPILYGLLHTPAEARMQAAKSASTRDCDAQLLAVARITAEEARRLPLVLIGPGATMLAVKRALGAGGTLLGVDAYAHGRLVTADADAARLAALVENDPPHLILGVVGGQGFLLGRGNQQLSPDTVRRAGKDRLIVLAAADKLARLPGGALLVDSGDMELDRLLAGYVPVRTGPRRQMMMRIDPA